MTDYTPIKKMMTGKMIEIYCADLHGQNGLCPECKKWQDRAFKHLDCCRHKEKGWPCNTCPDCCFTGADWDMMVAVQSHMEKWVSEHPEEAASVGVPAYHP